MTYYNLVFHMGDERFAGELAEAGVSGDRPARRARWRSRARGGPPPRPAGIETVLMAGPITPDDRLARVCEQSRGYIYGVNLMGITGERASLGEQGAVLAKRVKALTDKPVLMGFGVQHARAGRRGQRRVRRRHRRHRRRPPHPRRRRPRAELHAFVASLRAALDAS